MTIRGLLILLSVICFVLSALGVTSRINLQSLGLAFFSSAFLLA